MVHHLGQSSQTWTFQKLLPIKINKVISVGETIPQTVSPTLSPHQQLFICNILSFSILHFGTIVFVYSMLDIQANLACRNIFSMLNQHTVWNQDSVSLIQTHTKNSMNVGVSWRTQLAVERTSHTMKCWFHPGNEYITVTTPVICMEGYCLCMKCPWKQLWNNYYLNDGVVVIVIVKHPVNLPTYSSPASCSFFVCS